MAEYTATLETGVNGADVATSDTGSATQFDFVGKPFGNATVKYSNAHSYGSLSCAVSIPSADFGYVGWDSSTFGTLTELWGRAYIYFEDLPAAEIAIINFPSAWYVSLTTSGFLRVKDKDENIRGTGSVAINVDGWSRVEFHVINNTTTGSVEAKLFNDPDSTTVTETVSGSGFNTTASTTTVRFGIDSGFNVGQTVYFDNLLVNDTGYPGPAAGPPVQTILAASDSVDGNWHDNTGGTNLSGAIDESTFSDSDYITSELHPTTSTSRIKLASGIDPASSSGHVIHWRVRKDAAAGDTVDMTVTLRQGGGNSLGGGTQIATFTRTNVDGTGWTTYDETLSGGEADSITNYSDLYLEFTADT